MLVVGKSIGGGVRFSAYGLSEVAERLEASHAPYEVSDEPVRRSQSVARRGRTRSRSRPLEQRSSMSLRGAPMNGHVRTANSSISKKASAPASPWFGTFMISRRRQGSRWPLRPRGPRPGPDRRPSVLDQRAHPSSGDVSGISQASHQARTSQAELVPGEDLAVQPSRVMLGGNQTAGWDEC